MQDNPQNVQEHGQFTDIIPSPAAMKKERDMQIAAAAELLRPLMEAVAKLLSGNSDALQQIADAMNMQNERMAALERTVKKRLPVIPAQVRYMNEAIRNRTHALLDDKEDIDDKAYTKLARAIRRDVLVRCGAASLREVPDHEYSASMEQIEMWSNVLVIRDVVWEARDRVEALANAEQSAGVDGA